MIYSIPNFHGIHPYEILHLIIPYRIKLLLANGTWLIVKSWVGWYRDVLVLGIGSGERRSKCSSCYIGGGIYERSVLRIVARFDPFLNCLVGDYAETNDGMTYQLIDVPAPILAPFGRVR